MLKNNAWRLLIPLLSMLSLVPAAQVSAAPAANAITISPFLQNITIQSADGVKSFELELTNNSPSLQEIDLATHDFGSLNNTGGILLEGSNDTYSQHYGLASWLTLETDTVILNPHESRQVLVSITNRQDLQPGGHYGAVVASVKSLNDASGNHVIINQQLLSLILVDKQGGEHYDLRLAGVEQNGNWLHLPNDIKLHFRNPGNVHVTPRGRVLLKNPAGSIVAQGIINTESSFILPDTFRDVYVRLTPVGHALPLPGLYSVEVDYRYDGLNQTGRKYYAVRFINLKLYVALVVVALGAVWWFRRHRQGAKASQIK